jgi:hypothetical protein
MSVRVTCACGTSYELKDEFAGRLLACPQCGRENRVPAAVQPSIRPQADPAFDRDKFLLRQQRTSRATTSSSSSARRTCYGTWERSWPASSPW